MDAAKLQSKVWAGYAKAAKRIGPAFNLYRPISATNPLSNGPIATLNASFNAEDMSYGRPNKYGKPTWFCLVDGSRVLVGDYLINSDQTFFIAAMQPILPILAVDCNRTLNVLRPQQQSGIGAVGYGGDTDSNETPLMTGWPASVLQGTKGEKNEVNLPGDVRNPWWQILMPAYPGIVLRTADIVTDDIDRRYIVSSAELTDLGWRLTAQSAQT
ncbi:hypothetical protein KDW54_06745 [Burkholderia ambifaria]|uniref:hypothetical protein n=1 Tax=Burkholderia ambifaria TaxID=152480 RepID=UPI001B95C068|nr:hypothetical protein [Burkholderia ambifaria]MBR8182096.1 hypothetical protein [Burkholderia ambifaria]